MNGYRSILICPDGSKEGWADSEQGDARRAALRTRLVAEESLEWCEVSYGHDDGTAEKIGEYDRGYSSMYSTLHPFKQGDREFALYSHQYTGTCVMELPSCRHVCGECEWKAMGFCPTGFYVPTREGDTNQPEEPGEEDPVNGQFGFVCGCVWGDDTSWKIQFLDLSKLSEGKFTHDDRFGYLELAGSAANLGKSIRVSDAYDMQNGAKRWHIRISHEQHFGFRSDGVVEPTDEDERRAEHEKEVAELEAEIKRLKALVPAPTA
jgi:hypothetical protein